MMTGLREPAFDESGLSKPKSQHKLRRVVALRSEALRLRDAEDELVPSCSPAKSGPGQIAASWHERMGPELQRFGRAIYDNGYAEGLRGEPYGGATFIGYYGWCDGRDRRAS